MATQYRYFVTFTPANQRPDHIQIHNTEVGCPTPITTSADVMVVQRWIGDQAGQSVALLGYSLLRAEDVPDEQPAATAADHRP